MVCLYVVLMVDYYECGFCVVVVDVEKEWSYVGCFVYG